MSVQRLRAASPGPLSDKEIAELDKFLLDAEALDEAMDVCTLDGFLCAVLSGPTLILPSEWMRWMWDMKEGKRAPEFESEKQAQRIVELLMRHANDIALRLSSGSEHYEPLFYEHRINQRTVTIVDEWCCGYVKGIAIDAKGWEPLREAHPEWLESIELYGTGEGWDQLKTLVDNQPDAVARHQQWVNRIAPAARQIHAFWLARRAPESETIRGTQQPIRRRRLPVEMTRARVAQAGSSNRIALDISPYPRIIVPKIVVAEIRFPVEILRRESQREIERPNSRRIVVRHVVAERFPLVPSPHRRARGVGYEPRCVQMIGVPISGRYGTPCLTFVIE
jgi:uncharacterized protein